MGRSCNARIWAWSSKQAGLWVLPGSEQTPGDGTVSVHAGRQGRLWCVAVSIDAEVMQLKNVDF